MPPQQKTATNASTGAVLSKAPPFGWRFGLPIIATETTQTVQTG